MNPVVSAARRVAFAIWRRRVRAAFRRADPCKLFGLELVISKGVLHPKYFASSQLLARHLASLDLAGLRVADVGTGSGLLALVAARAGARVTAIDINPAAVECARANAQRNGLAHAVEVVTTDVFSSVPEGDFDLVISNPPFYQREPGTLEGYAFNAGADYAFFAKLAEALPRRLAPNGTLVLIHSSDADFEPVTAMLSGAGYAARTALAKRGLFETLTVEEFTSPRPRSEASPPSSDIAKGA